MALIILRNINIAISVVDYITNEMVALKTRLRIGCKLVQHNSQPFLDFIGTSHYY